MISLEHFEHSKNALSVGQRNFDKLLGASVVNVDWFGAVGDGVTDDTEAIRAAFAAHEGTIVFGHAGAPKTYLISGTIDFGPRHRIQGHGSTIVNSSSDFTFRYLTPLAAGEWGPDAHAHIRFENISIRAQNGIQINQQGDYVSVFKKQSMVGGVVFDQVKFFGTYAPAADPNWGTGVEATVSELKGYGVAIYATKLFDSKVTHCLFQEVGVGIFFDGCDINTIATNRFNVNGRWVHLYNHDTWGSQTKLDANDLLHNTRIGGVYLEGAAFTRIVHNYFETPIFSAQMIRSRGDVGTLIQGNRFDDSGSGNPDPESVTPTPYFSLAPVTGLKVTDNSYNRGDNFAPVEILGNYTTPYWGKVGEWFDNDWRVPVPDSPLLAYGPVQPYLFSATNWATLEGGAAATFLPWARDAATGRWAIKTADPSYTPETYFMTRFRLQSAGHRKFRATFVARSLGVAPSYGYYAVVCEEGGVSQTIQDGPLNFAHTEQSECEARTIYFSLPESVVGTGDLVVSFFNQQAALERIELTPLAVAPLSVGGTGAEEIGVGMVASDGDKLSALTGLGQFKIPKFASDLLTESSLTDGADTLTINNHVFLTGAPGVFRRFHFYEGGNNAGERVVAEWGYSTVAVSYQPVIQILTGAYDDGRTVKITGDLDGTGTLKWSHAHTVGNVTGLQTALDGKAALSHGHLISDVANLQTTLDGKAAASHTHAISDTTGLQTALDGKADESHSHIVDDVSGLRDALLSKADTGHTHTKSQITDFSHTHGISDVSGLQSALDGKAATSHGHQLTDIAITGTPNGSKFLRDDGSWQTPPGGSSGITSIVMPDEFVVDIDSGVATIGWGSFGGGGQSEFLGSPSGGTSGQPGFRAIEAGDIPSDARLKANVRSFSGGLDAIRRLNVREWEWNGLAGMPKGERSIGLVAQEAEAIVPEAVTTRLGKLRKEDKEPTDIYRVKPDQLIPYLINAIQEQQRQIEALRAEVHQLRCATPRS